MPLGTDVGLGSGDIVLDGDAAPLTERGTAAPPPHTFRPMSIAAKPSPISATAELLLTIIVIGLSVMIRCGNTKIALQRTHHAVTYRTSHWYPTVLAPCIIFIVFQNITSPLSKTVSLNRCTMR